MELEYTHPLSHPQMQYHLVLGMVAVFPYWPTTRQFHAMTSLLMQSQKLCQHQLTFFWTVVTGKNVDSRRLPKKYQIKRHSLTMYTVHFQKKAHWGLITNFCLHNIKFLILTQYLGSSQLPIQYLDKMWSFLIMISRVNIISMIN